MRVLEPSIVNDRTHDPLQTAVDTATHGQRSAFSGHVYAFTRNKTVEITLAFRQRFSTTLSSVTAF